MTERPAGPREIAHPETKAVRRWMRVVGAFYLAQFVGMAFLRMPIRSFGPAEAITLVESGDPVGVFLADTWVTFGLEVGTIGVVLLVAAARPRPAAGVAWTVLAIEVVRGIINDLYLIGRGIEVAGYTVWIVVHAIIIITGLLAVRRLNVQAPIPQPASR